MFLSKRLHQLSVRPDALGLHFDLGLQAYEAQDGAGLARHLSAVAMLPEGGPGAIEYLALRWRDLWLRGEREASLEVARDAARLYPDDADTSLELADLLRDLERPEDALKVLRQAARRNRDDAELWYELGLGAEAVEDWETRDRAFRRVWDLEHDVEPPHRLWVSEERFIAFADQALERLPPMAKKALGNVAVIVEDYPEDWIFETDPSDPRLLGLFAGAEHAVQMGVDFTGEGPSRIYLFRWNIERFCSSEEEVEEQVTITVLHEVGHYLGLDEEALDYLGLG